MKTAFGVILHLVAALSLNAEIIQGESIELIVDKHSMIGVYQVTAAEEKPNSFFNLSFRLLESLKGISPQLTSSSEQIIPWKWKSQAKPAVGERFLLFLHLNEKNGATEVWHLINLTKPDCNGFHSVAINSSFQVLTDEKLLLAAVRKRIDSPGKATDSEDHERLGWREVVPFDSPAHEVLYHGSMCFLLVPGGFEAARPFRR